MAEHGQDGEAGSFRDRDGRVFYVGDEVRRGLSARALLDHERLTAAPFFARAVEAGRLVATERLELEATSPEAGAWAAVLRHERVPFVSYPYEWCFSMLRDAALLQLELLQEAVEADLVLKDASPYNVQWFGARPVFIDTPSFTALQPGEAWPGYRQFCELCLYPLFLQAYKGVPFQPWLRGHLDGISPEDCAGLMSFRDLFRPGVLLHVKLHASLQRSQQASRRDVKRDLARAGFHKELVKANARKLHRLVKGLAWKAGKSTWSEYAGDNTYDQDTRGQKHAFVSRALQARSPSQVWDLGCNTGEYSRLAAEEAGLVIAMDGDHLAVERLYRALRDEGREDILPLVVNLADPSPDLGWRGLERRALPARGRPDLVLALALIHHLVIASHVPMDQALDWLASLGGDLVIEFVGKDDPMVQRLLQNKEDRYDDYEVAAFEAALEARYRLVSRQPVGNGTRILYHATPRG